MKNNLMINQTDGQLNLFVSDHELAQWEQRTGYKLPSDYRTFLLKYNGGMIKPRFFKHNHPDLTEDDDSMTLDVLYSWNNVIEYSNLDVLRDSASHPPHHIQIGNDPSNGRIL